MFWRVSLATKAMLIVAIVVAIGTAVAAGYVQWFNGDPELVKLGGIALGISLLFAFVSWIMTPPTLERIRPDEREGRENGPTIH